MASLEELESLSTCLLNSGQPASCNVEYSESCNHFDNATQSSLCQNSARARPSDTIEIAPFPPTPFRRQTSHLSVNAISADDSPCFSASDFNECDSPILSFSDAGSQEPMVKTTHQTGDIFGQQKVLRDVFSQTYNSNTKSDSRNCSRNSSFDMKNHTPITYTQRFSFEDRLSENNAQVLQYDVDESTRGDVYSTDSAHKATHSFVSLSGTMSHGADGLSDGVSLPLMETAMPLESQSTLPYSPSALSQDSLPLSDLSDLSDLNRNTQSAPDYTPKSKNTFLYQAPSNHRHNCDDSVITKSDPFNDSYGSLGPFCKDAFGSDDEEHDSDIESQRTIEYGSSPASDRHTSERLVPFSFDVLDDSEDSLSPGFDSLVPDPESDSDSSVKAPKENTSYDDNILGTRDSSDNPSTNCSSSASPKRASKRFGSFQMLSEPERFEGSVVPSSDASDDETFKSQMESPPHEPTYIRQQSFGSFMSSWTDVSSLESCPDPWREITTTPSQPSQTSQSSRPSQEARTRKPQKQTTILSQGYDRVVKRVIEDSEEEREAEKQGQKSINSKRQQPSQPKDTPSQQASPFSSILPSSEVRSTQRLAKRRPTIGISKKGKIPLKQTSIPLHQFVRSTSDLSSPKTNRSYGMSKRRT